MSCGLQDLASDLLSQASELTSQARMPSRQRFLMCRQVVITCLNRGQQCLAAKDPDAIELLKHAYKLITEHLVRMQDTAQLLSALDLLARATWVALASAHESHCSCKEADCHLLAECLRVP